MNAVEFVFALIAVFGSTAIIFAWTTLVYRLDQKVEKEHNDNEIDLIKFGE